MRVRALLLSIIFMFGEVSAGIAASIAIGAAATGASLATGAAVPAAIAAGVVAGAASASGRPTRVGIGCDGNGNNPHVETSFRTKEGREFGFRTDEWDRNKSNPNPQESTEERIKREFEARKKYEEEHRTCRQSLDMI